MSIKNLKTTIKVSLVFIVIAILFSSILYLIAVKSAIYRVSLTYPVPNKIPIGISDTPIEHPWGNLTSLAVFVDVENISITEREYYVYDVLLAMRYWENDKTHNLSYKPIFTITNKSKNANIIINWNETLYGGKNVLGHTYINSTGEYVKTCDPLIHLSHSVLFLFLRT